MSTIAWTASSDEENAGVDHLGMRVANESAYSRLIDFTTTVTWRPRYYSFLCWASQRAFLQNGGDFNRQNSTVDYEGYKKAIKRMEYGLVAASLVYDANASKVAGTDKISVALEELKKGSISELSLQGNHLKASTGGLSIYAGVMRELRLISSSEGFDIALPGSNGDALAKAFAQTLECSGLQNPLDKPALSLKDLEVIGAHCALSGLGEQALIFDAVRQERDLIRRVIFDWDNFHAGVGPSARRILSLGVILESRKLYSGRQASLALFREITLLGSANIAGKVVPLSLPPIYSQVLVEWSLYQVHAYITFALESILSLVLAEAGSLREEFGDKIRQADLVGTVVSYVAHGEKENGNTKIPKELDGWWNFSLAKISDLLEPVVAQGRLSPLCEPELFSSITKVANPKGSANIEAWAHHSYFLFLLACVRLRHLLKAHGRRAWIGAEQSFRLTPTTLISHLEKALCENLSTLKYLQRVTTELVIKQHHQNALRKLISQPDKDTAKFLLEGPYFVPVGTHRPGTSSPRYENAVLFLQDLGLLSSDVKAVVTPDGEAILDRIRGGAA